MILLLNLFNVCLPPLQVPIDFWRAVIYFYRPLHQRLFDRIGIRICRTPVRLRHVILNGRLTKLFKDRQPDLVSPHLSQFQLRINLISIIENLPILIGKPPVIIGVVPILPDPPVQGILVCGKGSVRNLDDRSIPLLRVPIHFLGNVKINTWDFVRCNIERDFPICTIATVFST